MKKNKIIAIEVLISLFLLICTLTNVTEHKYITAILVASLVLFLSKIITNPTPPQVNTKKITLIIVVFATLYVALFYTLGIYAGFSRNPISLGIKAFFEYIVPITIIIIAEENLRHILLSEKTLKSKALIIIIGTIIDISIYQGIYNLRNLEGFLAFIGLIFLTSIANNIFYTYISEKYGTKPIVIYRLITTLYPYIFPILPQVYTYFRIFVRMLYPLIMYSYIDKYFDLDKYQESTIEKRKQAISLAITSIIMIGMICLVSCKFTIGLLVIGSKSMTGSLEKGDVILYKEEINNIKTGDIIVFKRDNIRVVHRVIAIKNINNEKRYYTKGDANPIKDKGYVTNDTLIGKELLKIRFVGMPSLWIREKFE